MRSPGILTIVAAAGILIIPIRAQAQTPSNEVTCVQGSLVPPNSCPDTTISLRKSTAGDTYVTAAGYYKAADGGAGEFYRLGDTSMVCNSLTVSSGVTVTAGSPTVAFTPTLPPNLTVGEAVSSGTAIPQGAEIASKDTFANTITMTLAATNGASSVTISGDNGGTLILDNESPNKGCYQKTNYRGEPHEWGAKGDGAANDTIAIQNWLGAYGSVSNLAPATAPSNFGPWIATIPATYLVSSPLFCPANATIQGDENDANIGTGSNPNPRINFKASSTFSGFTYPASPPATYYGLQGVIGAYDYCRLSGIAVTGNKFDLTANGTTHGTTTIDGLNSTSGVQIGNTVAAADVSAGTVVKVVNSTCTSNCSVTVSQATTGGGTASEAVTFYGPDAVDVLGPKVVIDGFSLLVDGHDDLFCGLPNLDLLGLQVKDTHLQTAMLDGIDMPGPCSNVRLIGDNVSQAGADGILFGATEGSIEGGVIQDSGNAGLHLKGASLLSVSGMHIQGNGRNDAGGAAGAGIAIDQAHTISICGNHLEGNGGDTPASSQIYFTNNQAIDNVTLCGNVYAVQNAGKKNPSTDVTPLYVYDADSNATLTNVHLYETAAQPAVSIFSPAAQALLQPLVAPRLTQNQIGGLTLSNNTGNAQAVDVASGSATDSTNSALVTLATTCTIDLTKNGPGGLDTGSVLQKTTYFMFVVAPAAGNGTPSCIASTSLIPAFTDTHFQHTGYQLAAVGGTLPAGSTIYNATPLNGVIVGDALTSPDLNSGTVITGFSANTQPSSAGLPITGTFASTTTITLDNTNVTGIQQGMAILDSGGCISAKNNPVVQSFSNPTITISNAVDSSCVGKNYSLSISGARQLVLNQNASTQAYNAPLTISTGYYRLIGALYTDNTNPTAKIVKFTQDGDTFYLATPVADIPVTGGCSAGGGSRVSCALSVPCGRNAPCAAGQGVHVEALGRILGGGGAASTNRMLVTSPDQTTPGSPKALTASPGYSAVNPASDTAFPFRLYTDLNQSTGTSAGSVDVQTNNPSTTVNEITDGWVFHR